MSGVSLGQTFPDFWCDTTRGSFTFHAFCENGRDDGRGITVRGPDGRLLEKKESRWTVLFSHPAAFTPVCTSELASAYKRLPEFEKRNTQLIGLSCDAPSANNEWAADIRETAEIVKEAQEQASKVGVGVHLGGGRAGKSVVVETRKAEWAKVAEQVKEHRTSSHLAMGIAPAGRIPRNTNSLSPARTNSARSSAVLSMSTSSNALSSSSELIVAQDQSGQRIVAGDEEEGEPYYTLKQVLEKQKKLITPLPFPIITDPKRAIATKLGMLDPQTATNFNVVPKAARATFIIDPEMRLAASILYPLRVGRNFDEILRLIDALQVGYNSRMRLAPPADWQPGEPTLAWPSDAFDGETEKIALPLPSRQNYFQFVPPAFVEQFLTTSPKFRRNTSSKNALPDEIMESTKSRESGWGGGELERTMSKVSSDLGEGV
mmetsp:Transcript_1226/g.2714  ORF Transcript_1226/g.2714 Transcript_1226/m.2714 type:complete len:432 (+) Transcript_1226:619-1914(+)